VLFRFASAQPSTPSGTPVVLAATFEREKDPNPTSPPDLVPAYEAPIGFCQSAWPDMANGPGLRLVRGEAGAGGGGQRRRPLQWLCRGGQEENRRSTSRPCYTHGISMSHAHPRAFFEKQYASPCDPQTVWLFVLFLSAFEARLGSEANHSIQVKSRAALQLLRACLVRTLGTRRSVVRRFLHG
jgi:hypothetical protein